MMGVMEDEIKRAAAALGKRGGRARSPAKQAAARRNGQRGGRKSRIELAARTLIEARKENPDSQAVQDAIKQL
jgi:hypothetical protein